MIPQKSNHSYQTMVANLIKTTHLSELFLILNKQQRASVNVKKHFFTFRLVRFWHCDKKINEQKMYLKPF